MQAKAHAAFAAEVEANETQLDKINSMGLDLLDQNHYAAAEIEEQS